jgi:hypothetical protein
MNLGKVVYEKHHNCVLPKGLVVHHIDQNQFHNNIENLVVLSCSAHRKLHWMLLRAGFKRTGGGPVSIYATRSLIKKLDAVCLVNKRTRSKMIMIVLEQNIDEYLKR